MYEELEILVAVTTLLTWLSEATPTAILAGLLLWVTATKGS
jgi:hypothetical protein